MTTTASLTATITRCKLYPAVARPGPAWRWSYDVRVTGEPFTFQRGPGLAETMTWINRSFPGATIVKQWEAKTGS